MRAIIIGLACLFMAKGEASQSSEEITLRDLPKDIFEEFMMLFKGQSLVETVGCINPRPSDFELLLYTRLDQYQPVVLDVFSSSPIKSNKPLIFITHSWIQSGKHGYGMEELKDAYLERYDANVVIVNWEKLSWDLYSRTACKVPKIARMIADYLCQINYEKGIPLDSVHLVGHSVGAQMFGFVGQFTQQMCNQRIGRITALDPAGPLYNGAPTSKRLDESDASFVDVIHTNSKTFGYNSPAGHADFYVNCGDFQPSCVFPGVNINNLINLPLKAVFCSHLRSIDYMTESITTNNFVGTKCNYCPIGCPPIVNLMMSSGKATLGQQCTSDTRGKYFVPTNIKSPYASGRS